MTLTKAQTLYQAVKAESEIHSIKWWAKTLFPLLPGKAARYQITNAITSLRRKPENGEFVLADRMNSIAGSATLYIRPISEMKFIAPRKLRTIPLTPIPTLDFRIAKLSKLLNVKLTSHPQLLPVLLSKIDTLIIELI